MKLYRTLQMDLSLTNNNSITINKAKLCKSIFTRTLRHMQAHTLENTGSEIFNVLANALRALAN